MVDIIPFKGLIYNDRFKDDMGSLVSPPYDIIPPELKQDLKDQNTYNIVNLILPDATEQTDDIYRSAKIKLEEWIREKVLVKDKKECLYIIEESFETPDGPGKMVGLIALSKIEEYQSKIILRHEKTLKKPREDRLNLLKECRTNFGLIYLLYDDENLVVQNILESYMKEKPAIMFRPFYDKSLYFRLWKITDADDIKAITESMKKEQPLIADGHHRYETSRTYKHLVANPKNGPQDYILTLYVSSRSKDISIHPTHRVVNFIPDIDPSHLLSESEELFETIKADYGPVKASSTISDIDIKGRKSLAVYFGDAGTYILTLKKNIKDIYPGDKNINLDYEGLDVNLLHKLLFERCLDNKIRDIKYIHTIDELKAEVDSGNFQAGFILNPPSIDVVKRLSVQDQVMPQKSTYFYPKPCTGLVTYKFE